MQFSCIVYHIDMKGIQTINQATYLIIIVPGGTVVVTLLTLSRDIYYMQNLFQLKKNLVFNHDM